MRFELANKKGFFHNFFLNGIIMMVLGLCLFSVTGKALAEQLELDDQAGGMGSYVIFTLSVNNAPNDVDSLGVDIGFDQNMLQYVNADFTGSLMDSWSFKDVSNPDPGVLRLGGFTTVDAITAGTSGTLVKITFTVIGDQNCQLPLSNLVDGIAGWTTKDGSFTYLEFVIEPSSVTLCVGASAKFTVVPQEIGIPPFTWWVNDEIVQEGDSRTLDYIFIGSGNSIIRVEDSSVPALSAQASATVMDEDDSGALDIIGDRGAAGSQVVITVQIQNAPNDVSAFGADILFDQNILEFVSADFTDTLIENFDFKSVSNPSPGVLRLGGFEAGEDIITISSSGDLVYLTFNVASSIVDCISSFLELGELKDDIGSWSTSWGCFFNCGCNGDVNGDGEITPIDALCAFETYLLICPTSCGIPCDQVCCDVSIDFDCTPDDALCIFKKYLLLPSCLD